MTDPLHDAQYLSELASRAEAGDNAAAFELGEIYREGEHVAQNWQAAFRWYHLAATRGDAEAQNNLGTMYQNGLGCDADSTLAAHWYQQSARQGNAVAQFNLGSATRLATASILISRRRSTGSPWRPSKETPTQSATLVP